ncbi:MAG: CARDB domain-containing protein [bacterium]|nr:CARDB domain-containing protein [bacterium]
MKHIVIICFLMLLTTGINNSYADEQATLSATGTESVPCASIIIRDITFKLISTTLNDPDAVQPEDTVLIQGIIENIGKKDYLSNLDVQVLWGTTTITTKSVPCLLAGETFTIGVEKTFLCEQAQGITIKCNGEGIDKENIAASSTSSVDEFILHDSLMPDLIISNISLAGHYVHLTIENKGQGMTAPGKVAVHVFIDGKMQGRLGSSYFDNLSFRRPGGRKGINTGFSISGTHTIMAVIDPEPFNMINESDEKNNTATATIVAPSSTRDLIITDIDYDQENGIVPVVSNQGSIGYAAGTMIKVNIRVNKQQVSGYTYTLDNSLEPKTTVRLIPPALIKIKESSRVLVRIDPIPENLDDENINNIMEKKIQM